MSNPQRMHEVQRLGFYVKRIQTGGRPATRWACRCSKCDFEETFGWPANSSPEFMEKTVLKFDWHYHHKQLVCGPCHREMQKQEKKMTNKIEPVSNPKLQRKVFALLDDHFDEDKRLYRAGWTDKKIAEAAQTSEQFVSSVRKGAYGELAEDPTVTAIRSEIDELKTEAQSLGDLLMERMAKIEEKITQLHTRLDGYAMKKVV